MGNSCVTLIYLGTLIGTSFFKANKSALKGGILVTQRKDRNLLVSFIL